MDKQPLNMFRYLTPILLAIVGLMLFLIYFKKEETAVQVETPTASSNKVVKKQSTQASAPIKKSITLPTITQPDIKTVSRHSAIVMSYLNRSLPISKESPLVICVDHMKRYEFTEARTCLNSNFGSQEEHASWFRALLQLATEGKATSILKFNKIASAPSHIYQKQAKALLSTIK